MPRKEMKLFSRNIHADARDSCCQNLSAVVHGPPRCQISYAEHPVSTFATTIVISKLPRTPLVLLSDTMRNDLSADDSIWKMCALRISAVLLAVATPAHPIQQRGSAWPAMGRRNRRDHHIPMSLNHPHRGERCDEYVLVWMRHIQSGSIQDYQHQLKQTGFSTIFLTYSEIAQARSPCNTG
jgi:hypothetical protein